MAKPTNAELKTYINGLVAGGQHPILAGAMGKQLYDKAADYLTAPIAANPARRLVLRGTKVRRWLAEGGRAVKLQKAWDDRAINLPQSAIDASFARELERMLVDAIEGDLDVEGTDAKAILTGCVPNVISTNDRDALVAIAEKTGASMSWQQFQYEITAADIGNAYRST